MIVDALTRVAPRMTVGDTFASKSAKGYLMRAGVAWILITPAVAGAKIGGSVARRRCGRCRVAVYAVLAAG